MRKKTLILGLLSAIVVFIVVLLLWWHDRSPVGNAGGRGAQVVGPLPAPGDVHVANGIEAATPVAAARPSASPAPPGPEDAQFGEYTSSPIDSGFVFVDGQYLASPYVVTRRGLALYIKDVLMEKEALPPPPEPEPRVDQDPPLPEGLSEKTDLLGDVVNDHSMRKWYYLTQHYAPDEAAAKMLAYYRTLPFVRSVELSDCGEQFRFEIITQKYGKLGIRQEKPGIDCSLRHSRPEDVPVMVQKWATSYESALTSGGCLFVKAGHGESGQWPPHSVRSKLAAVVRVLSSNRSEEEKEKDLKSSGLTENGYSRLLIRNFRPSAQLDARLAALQESRR